MNVAYVGNVVASFVAELFAASLSLDLMLPTIMTFWLMEMRYSDRT